MPNYHFMLCPITTSCYAQLPRHVMHNYHVMLCPITTSWYAQLPRHVMPKIFLLNWAPFVIVSRIIGTHPGLPIWHSSLIYVLQTSVTKLVQVGQWFHMKRTVTELANKLSTFIAIEDSCSTQNNPLPVYYPEPEKSIPYPFTSFL